MVVAGLRMCALPRDRMEDALTHCHCPLRHQVLHVSDVRVPLLIFSTNNCLVGGNTKPKVAL